MGAGCQARPAIQLPSVADSSTALFDASSVKVIHRYNSAGDVVVVRLYLLGGTRQLTQKNAGIEVLLLRAAVLENGHTVARTGSRQVLEGTADWTVVGFVSLRKDLDSAWSGFARQFQQPRFSDASLERARGELLAAARRRYTHPELRVRSNAQQAAFRGHPYALDPEGTVESLSSLSRADLEHYREEQFVTSRMLLVVIGAITRARIDSMVATTLGQLPTGRYEWTLPPAVPPRQTSWSVAHENLPTNYILGYFSGPTPTDPDYFPFRIAVALLSGQLFGRLREERPLSYAAYAPFLNRARPIGGVYTSTSRPDEAMLIIRRTLYESTRPLGLRGQPPWWDRFVNQFALEKLMERLTSEGQAETLARAYLLFGDLAMADDFVRRLRKVELSAVRRVAGKWFQGIQYGYLGDTVLMQNKW